MQSQRDELASQRLVKHYIMLSLNMSVTCSACLFDLLAVGRFIYKLLIRRCKRWCVTKLYSTRCPQSHPCLNGFFLTSSLLLLFHFCVFLSQLSDLVWSAGGRNKPSTVIKAFPFSWSSGQRQ